MWIRLERSFQTPMGMILIFLVALFLFLLALYAFCSWLQRKKVKKLERQQLYARIKHKLPPQ